MPAKRYLIVHGHFYQPPRENPWTERIDRQDGAAPYHDWNERITRECYLPNARSRRLDGYGRVLSIVNNYEHISFNFGPTLISWIESHHPGLYRRILDADAASVLERSGHGNAIAQVYNHMIMPLATPRDRRTQIRWGIHDFSRRFGREPEGIWLAETAINDDTLEIVIEEGIRYIILSPHQADRIRPIEGGEWTDVSDGSIEAGTPYRCFGPRRWRSRRRWIDIFFYDATISTDVSFNHLLRSGDSLADAIAGAYARGGGDLVSIATDGEVYGHHEPFGDMALAYLIEEAARARGITMTNFGAYLDAHEPAREAQIKQGRGGEGTAWSCSHGVGRWKEDCGCNTGAPAGWDQKWRAPLRRGLDRLRDGLAGIFEAEGGKLLADPWKARDEYIAVLDGRAARDTAGFVDAHAARTLAEDERRRAAALLESQRHAQLMYTSCGWFFNDISGIETTQLMKYAARAIELAGAGRSDDLEGRLLGELRLARSNIPALGTGAEIYLETKRASAAEPAIFAGQFVLARQLQSPEISPESFGWRFEIKDARSRDSDGRSLVAGLLAMTSGVTLEEHRFGFLCGFGPPAEAVCAVIPSRTDDDYEELRNFFDTTESSGAKAVRTAAAARGWRLVTINDLFPDDRRAILERLGRLKIAALEDTFGGLYSEIAHLLTIFRQSGIAAPDSLVSPARAYLAHRLAAELAGWDRSLDPAGLRGISSVMGEASETGIELETYAAAEAIERVVVERLSALRGGLDTKVTGAALRLVERGSQSGIEPPAYEIQNVIDDLLDGPCEAALAKIDARAPGSEADAEAVSSLLALARRMNFNTDRFEKRLP
ncbi:MAG: DUF3536 domain-containing protein [Candidatus Krumholzibacteria bacterium]|nr:DUF3536 domain-containing protein [Candidatus Krumholzibacteria bacterium]